MQRKKYAPSGLATLALTFYLLRGELPDCLSSHFPEAEEHHVALGQTLGLARVDILRDDILPANIKNLEGYAESVFRDIRMLSEYPRRRNDVVSAWLVNGSGIEASSDSRASADTGNNNTASSAGAVINEEQSNSSTDPTSEDMDLIDALWQQDIDMGVGREAFDPMLRMEMEKERQLELKKQAEKEAAAVEARRKLLASNFTVDQETGELIPLATAVCGGAAASANEKAFELGFWSRTPSEDPLESYTYSIEELLGESSAASSAADTMMTPQYGAADTTTTPQYGMSYEEDSFLTQLAGEMASAPYAYAAYGGGSGATVLSAVQAEAGQLPGAVLPPVTFTHAAPLAEGRVGVAQAASAEGFGSCWETTTGYLGSTVSAGAAVQERWLDCSDEPAYDFSVFSGLEDEEECGGACASLPVTDISFESMFRDVAPISDLDLDSLDIDYLGMDDDKSSFDVTGFTELYANEPDAVSLSSDSAFSSDAPSITEDCSDNSTGFSRLGTGGVLPKSRPKKAMSGVAAVQHNHTYTAQPGGQPHVRKMDMKKPSHDDSLTRDERHAKEIGLPFAVADVVSAPVDEFNAMMRAHVLTDEQMRLVRDIRRRGKNKVAAQNCRRRKMGALVELGESLESLRERRRVLLEQRATLRQETAAARSKLAVLYHDVFTSLRTDSGAPYESTRFELRLVDGEPRRLLLLPTASGGSIGAAALREAIASSTSLTSVAAHSANKVEAPERPTGRARSQAPSQK